MIQCFVRKQPLLMNLLYIWRCAFQNRHSSFSQIGHDTLYICSVIWKQKSINFRKVTKDSHGQSRSGRKLTVEQICLRTSRISFWITFKSFLPTGSADPSSAFSYSSLKSHLSNASFVFTLDMTSDNLCIFSLRSQSGTSD